MAELITPQELRDLLRTPNAPTIVDVRSREQFEVGHLPGALNIPGDQLERRMHLIPRDMPVVTY